MSICVRPGVIGAPAVMEMSRRLVPCDGASLDGGYSFSIDLNLFRVKLDSF